MQIFFQGESLKPLMWRPLFHVPEWSWLGEYTGPAGPCFITSSQNTKHCEGQHGDCVLSGKLEFTVNMTIYLIDKCSKYRRICLSDIQNLSV